MGVASSMLTVNDALQLEVFRGSQVVAGHNGLNRTVEWLHNVGVPDAANWLNGGELVLTTWINLPETRPEQEEYLRAVSAAGIAGLCIAVGRYIPHIPDYLYPIADGCDLPLIAVPYQARFVDIARAVNELIAQREVRQALNIHQALTRLVLEGGDIKDLAVTLAMLVQQSVSIENDRFEAFASHNLAAIDEARRYTQIHGRTDPRLVRALEERGYLPEIKRTLRPVNLPKMPDVGLEMERILAPIVVHGDLYGYVWIIADGRPLSELERMAIESGATIAALMLLRQEAVQREEASQRGDLLSSLMQDDAANREELLTDRALRYGVDLRKPFRVLLVDGATQGLSRQYNRINRLVEKQGWAALVGQFAGQILLLIQEGKTLATITTHLQNTLNGDLVSRIGISAARSGVERVAQAYSEAREVLQIARQLKHESRIAHFDDLGYLHMLYRAGAGSLDGNPYTPALRLLLKEQQADLFHTLEVYLDTGGNGVATAERLHIHRSTLNYRLERIREICQTNLSDPTIQMNLQMALKLMRLFELN
ncbi:MAG TPA: PucR family transcriptional regulator ligand-binding domain-containing protein [Phototrophicaceae bacterium]|jgi:purine catabolism regulator|nr:PucR family transcriptional regulator ligand-binding domain-containing protein [Phototrophicaceae bacterium]